MSDVVWFSVFALGLSWALFGFLFMFYVSHEMEIKTAKAERIFIIMVGPLGWIAMLGMAALNGGVKLVKKLDETQ